MNDIIFNIVEAVVGVALTYFFGSTGFDLHKNSKANKLQKELEITYRYASGIVSTLSQRGDLPNSAKFKQAFEGVVDKLNKKGIHVSAETIENKINQAYQDYKASGGDIHKFGEKLTEEAIQDTERKFVTPEDRQVNTRQGAPFNPYK